VELDITDAEGLRSIFAEERPDAVLHLAAESHVDRSIDGPEAFVRTNVLGTQRLLEATRGYLSGRDDATSFRFLHVSTDEVYGSLGPDDAAFSESSPYRPRSPYAASKAAADHLARAYHHTYGLPVIVTNCSNNYGPYQYPEKLIPLTILKALAGEPVPVYGDGSNVRDWLHVDDHVAGLLAVVDQGRPGETYLIGGSSERTNLQVVHAILRALEDLAPSERDRRDLIRFVPDRPGHDLRYAVDTTRVRRELGWRPTRTFDEGIASTVQWYLQHADWSTSVTSGRYRLQRLGSLA
jgi:dTDP-glucose 4,6-dehydratase